MTPEDVLFEITAFGTGPRFDPQDELIATWVWCSLAERIKPKQAFMPMSPQEVDRSKLILGWVLDALNKAHARRPAHVRPVSPGGR